MAAIQSGRAQRSIQLKRKFLVQGVEEKGTKKSFRASGQFTLILLNNMCENRTLRDGKLGVKKHKNPHCA